MTIENRNLKPGTVLVAVYPARGPKHKEYHCEVVAGEEGKVAYRLKDGRKFTSPSAAGTAVMGGTACNGWRFWSPVGEEPKPKRTSKKGGNPGKGKNGLIERLEDGRFFCSACMEPFDAPEGVEPLGCPQGHMVEGG